MSAPAGSPGPRGLPLSAVAVLLPAAAAGWVLCGCLLLLAGAYEPAVAVPVCAVAALAVAVAGAGSTRALPRTPALPAALCVLLAAAATALSWRTATAPYVLRRDPAVYALSGRWLAGHGSLPVPSLWPARPPGLLLGSPGLYVHGTHPPALVPQFMTGFPLLLAVGRWAGGDGGLAHVGPVLAGAAVLAVAGLAARLAGGWAGVLAAALSALSFPLLHAARTTLSEPLAAALLAAGLLVLPERPGQRRALAAAGLLAGSVVAVRADGLADLLALLPFAGLVAARWGRRDAAAFAAGLAGAVLVGGLDGAVVAPEYLLHIGGHLALVGAAAAVLAGATVLVLRRPGWWAALRRVVPPAGAALVVAGVLAAALRPLVQVARDPHSPARGVVGGLQVRQHLPYDPTRIYTEHTLGWLLWWVGVPALVLATAGVAGLLRHRLTRPGPAAAFALVAALGGGLTLWQPAITPDHPFADRRFVPLLLPAVAVGAAVAITVLLRAVRARTGRRGLTAGLATLLAAATLAPAALATAPLAGSRTEAGEVAFVQALCRALPPAGTVLLAGPRAARELLMPVRTVCGRRVAALAVPGPGALRAAGPAVGGAVALAEDPGPLRAAGLHPVELLALRAAEDARLLTRRPRHTVSLDVTAWVARLP